MQLKTSLILAAATVAVLAGCAQNRPVIPGDNTVAGKHLVYRDPNGVVLRQFDYPSDDICRRVEAVAGRSARCQPESISQQLQARAMLRYEPPGIDVVGHYRDFDRCQLDTRDLGAGVRLITACAAK